MANIPNTIKIIQKYLQQLHVPTEKENNALKRILNKERFEKIPNSVITQLAQENDYALTIILYSIFNNTYNKINGENTTNLNIDTFAKSITTYKDNEAIKKCKENIVETLKELTKNKEKRPALIKNLQLNKNNKRLIYSYDLDIDEWDNQYTIVYYSEFNYLINNTFMPKITDIHNINIFKLINFYMLLKINLNKAQQYKKDIYKKTSLKELAESVNSSVPTVRLFISILMYLGLIEKDAVSDMAKENSYKLSVIWVYHIKKTNPNLLNPKK